MPTAKLGVQLWSQLPFQRSIGIPNVLFCCNNISIGCIYTKRLERIKYFRESFFIIIFGTASKRYLEALPKGFYATVLTF